MGKQIAYRGRVPEYGLKFSNGCIRLENAGALGQWLLHRSINTKSKTPEQAVPLPVEVPVYLTYITAIATDRGIAFRNDVYGRDG